MNILKKNFYKKKVLITGHTGFKGSWLTLILKTLGSKIAGYALNPISKPNFFDDLNLGKFLKKDVRSDISDLKKIKKVINAKIDKKLNSIDSVCILFVCSFIVFFYNMNT